MRNWLMNYFGKKSLFYTDLQANISEELQNSEYLFKALGAEFLPCALSYRFIFSSETDSMTLGESEKTGAVFWVMVG